MKLLRRHQPRYRIRVLRDGETFIEFDPATVDKVTKYADSDGVPFNPGNPTEWVLKVERQ